MQLLGLYLIGALAMFAIYVFPPTAHAQEEQQKVLVHFRDRRVRMWVLIVFASLLWPLVVLWSLLSTTAEMEWYE